MPPRVILIGPPGAGKSSVGKSLARLLNDEFVDTDSVIAEQENLSISEIFVDFLNRSIAKLSIRY